MRPGAAQVGATGSSRVRAPAAPPPTGGWTDLSLQAGGQLVFVSQNGSDSNDGLSSSTPKATLAAGYARIRNGLPDQLLIERGSVLSETFPKWDKAGPSAAARQVVASYGAGPRPVIRFGSNAFGLWIVDTAAHVIVADLEMYPTARDPSKGDYDAAVAQANNGSIAISIYHGPDDVIVEGCDLHHCGTNVGLQNGVTNVTVRRNVIRNAYAQGTSHSQGIFCNASTGALFEENVLFHNGWDEIVPGALSTVFNHNIYADAPAASYTFRKNLSVYASSMGHKLRSDTHGQFHDFTVEDNAIYACPLAISMGGVTSAEQLMFLQGVVQRNAISTLFYHPSTAYTSNQHQGIDLVSGDSVSIGRNWMIDTVSGTSDFGVRAENQQMVNVAIFNNVFKNWSASPRITNQAAGGVGVSISGNTTPNAASTDVAGGVAYVDPSVSFAAYAAAHGYASFDALIAAALGQQKTSWSDALTGGAISAYIGAGLTPA